MKPLHFLLATTFIFAILLVGCDITGADADGPARETIFEQTFNADTDGWDADETSGKQGWCGSIVQHGSNSGPATPSARTVV